MQQNPIDIKLIRRRLFLMGLLKIPMIGFVRPKLKSLSDTTSEILVPFRRRSKNHLGSMYFGAMMVGAELSAGVFVLQWMSQNKNKFSFVFSHAEGDFNRRAESDIVFRCEDGSEVLRLFDLSRETGERQATTLHVSAYDSNKDQVATFSFTLSVRVKN